MKDEPQLVPGLSLPKRCFVFNKSPVRILWLAASSQLTDVVASSNPAVTSTLTLATGYLAPLV